MSILQVSSRRIGREPDCTLCGAGSTISFNWKYATTAARPESKLDSLVFIEPQPLRYGTLFRCRSCGQPWYLDGEQQFMNFMPRDRLPLIQDWNRQPIALRSEHVSELRKIGRTPPDLYGNGAQFHETPCAVTAGRGERFELAIVSLERHPPFEDWRTCRLATEIARIEPSPYALPLAIRVASSQAEEMRMGLAPTLVEAPDGALLTLNSTQSFLVREGCPSSEVVLSNRQVNLKKLPPVYSRPEGIVYFVADPIPDGRLYGS
jgi:hypothetical protein